MFIYVQKPQPILTVFYKTNIHLRLLKATIELVLGWMGMHFHVRLRLSIVGLSWGGDKNIRCSLFLCIFLFIGFLSLFGIYF